jgi:uncharacterized membrane protein YeaQ/YmgE (transglycosylase-associated protein family)
MIFAGMDPEALTAWVVICTLAGAAARQLVQGKQHWGLWGDLIIALFGAFVVGWAMTEQEFSIARNMQIAQPDVDEFWAGMVDVFLAAFVGALIIRIILKFLKQ